MEDQRFLHVGRDPKFRSMPRKLKKVKIDKRFSAMFKDKRFKTKCTVDKRGRPVNLSSSEDLKRYYDTHDISDEDDAVSSHSEGDETGMVTSRVRPAVEKADTGSDASEDRREVPLSESEVSSKTQKRGIELKSKHSTLNSSKSLKPKSKSKAESKDSDEAGPIDKLSQTKENRKGNKKQKNIPSVPESDNEDDEPLDEEVRGKLLDMAVDYARGGGVLAEDSSSDDESEPEQAELEHDWAEMDREADRIDDSEVTSRLAVCNMDWDRIKAADIMVLMHSFLPPGGVISDVKIYPSEFGKKKMAEEEERGPSELFSNETERVTESSDDDADEGFKEVSEEALEQSQVEHVRRYQLSRLRYYYAIVTCDSPSTANKLYEECEGLEFESSASRVDLRFVPDDMTFDDAPREECTSMPEAGRYRPSQFVTTALQQRLVRFTWDETDADRQEAVRRARERGADADDADLRAYLADSSDEEPAEDGGSEAEEGGVLSEKDRIAKYRALLTGGDEANDSDQENDGVEMEISWGGVGIKEKTEEIVKKKGQQKDLTPWEKYIDKQKQKKREDKKKSKPIENTVSSDSASGDDSDGDDVPSDLADDPFFKEELDARKREESKHKTKKNKKQPKAKESEEGNGKDQDQLALLTMGEDEEDSRRHFNFKQIVKDETTSGKKKKWKKKRKPAVEEVEPEDDFQIDVSDPRFAKLYNSAKFNLDPSDTRFKRTSAMERLVKEKQRRVVAGETKPEEPEPKKARVEEDAPTRPGSQPTDDLSALVTNIKSRAKHMARRRANGSDR